jgi:hypothetical protein
MYLPDDALPPRRAESPCNAQEPQAESAPVPPKAVVSEVEPDVPAPCLLRTTFERLASAKPRYRLT